MKWQVWLCGLLIVAFAWLFSWAYQRPLDRSTVVSGGSLVEGRYGAYSYTVSGQSGGKEQSVTFSPALKSDDAAVIGALRQVSRIIFSEMLIDNVQPVVETLDERQYITFMTINGKIFFQLFKDESGSVGSARFWRDTIKSLY